MGAAAATSREDAACLGGAPIWEASDSLDAEAKAWAQSLAHAKCSAFGGLSVVGQDVPPELGAPHRELLRVSLLANKSLRSLSVGDVSSGCARLLAEASSQAAGERLAEVKFLGPRADDALARLLGMLLRPVWSAGAPGLRSLTIAHPRRNLLSDQGGVQLAQALEENRCLRTLVLFGTQIGDGTAWALSTALEQNTTLEVLVLYGKRLSGRGLSALTRAAKGVAARQLRELVIGGTDFRDEEAAELVRAVASRRPGASSSSSAPPAAAPAAPEPLQRFGLLSAVLGDETARAVVASGLLASGLREAAFVLGRLSDDGMASLAAALTPPPSQAPSEDDSGAGGGVAWCSPGHQSLCHLRVASNAAGDTALAAFESVWSKPGLTLEILELALGAASEVACARCCTTTISTEDGCPPRKFSATNGFGAFMDEVVFQRLLLRSPIGEEEPLQGL